MDDEKEKVSIEATSLILLPVLASNIYSVYFVDLGKVMNEIKQSNSLLCSLTFSERLFLLRSSLRLTLLRCSWWA